MGQSIFERIQAKIELFRLEQRYTRRRHRRSTFVSNAVYVDGEYIYNTPNSTGSSYNSNASNSYNTSTYHASVTAAPPSENPSVNRKKLNRFSSMPGFGSLSRGSGGPTPPVVTESDWRRGRASFDGTRR